MPDLHRYGCRDLRRDGNDAQCRRRKRTVLNSGGIPKPFVAPQGWQSVSLSHDP